MTVVAMASEATSARITLMAMGPTIVLAKNDGKGKFERIVSLRAPTPAPFYSLSAADYDHDLGAFEYRAAEMTDGDALDALAASLDSLDVLVNNAGASLVVEEAEQTLDSLEAVGAQARDRRLEERVAVAHDRGVGRLRRDRHGLLGLAHRPPRVVVLVGLHEVEVAAAIAAQQGVEGA